MISTAAVVALILDTRPITACPTVGTCCSADFRWQWLTMTTGRRSDESAGATATVPTRD
eukprot:CAMPEP_0182576676 /NCGR_PEP_ID=MMETSP1324-20130603/34705_1 /TAXON_ID=236786 /ORGANISM="Florenciella sp., Strain RCC1587" /LENGTH=58 /DNA_ID=CAMNT_0024792407 /DNA_START=96 /DNA_END=269 /DNA_ORIENTATION=+